MILARDSAVPSLGEAAADDYEEIDVEDDDSETERYEIVQLMREQFGEREMTRSLVIDPTQDHMRLALSFISFPRKVRVNKRFSIEMAILRFEEDECELVPPMVTEDDRRLMAHDFNTSSVVCEVILSGSNDEEEDKTLSFLDCECETGIITVRDVVIASTDDDETEDRRITVNIKLDDFNLSCIMSLPIEAASTGEEKEEEEEEANAFGGVRMEMGVVVGSDEEDDSFINDDVEEEDDSFIVRTSEEEEEEEKEDSVIVLSSGDDDDEEEEVKKKKKKSKKKKRRRVQSDSDDDDDDEVIVVEQENSRPTKNKRRRKAIVDSSSSEEDDEEEETEESRRKKRAEAALARMNRMNN